MGILDIFSRKKEVSKPSEIIKNESNTVFGQTMLGNNVVYQGASGKQTVSQQLLYVTTSSVTSAGRTVDMATLTRNSTVMACVGAKARALAQLPKRVTYKLDDGTFVDALQSSVVGARDKARAKQAINLLTNPNNFQSDYEFWYQWCMWQDLMGECFTLWWRKDQKDASQMPIEMYNLDASLITTQLTPTRYPSYRLTTPSYGFNKDEPLASHQVMHISEMAWQGSAGFNKGILATELIALDQDIDLYANFIMLNGAKPSGIFSTTQVIPDAKYKEIAQRLKETWNAMTGGRSTDESKAGQGMLLDQGMTYTPVDMLTLQDAQTAELKIQTMKRICGLFGVPPAMIGIQDQKYNNTQTMLDEFYKSTMSPMLKNVQQKLKQHLFKGYPNLYVEFDTTEFLEGSPLDQMNFAVAGVNAGILTPNEAREFLGKPQLDGANELLSKSQSNKQGDIAGTSPQDTGGGGGNQKSKMNIGK